MGCETVVCLALPLLFEGRQLGLPGLKPSPDFWDYFLVDSLAQRRLVEYFADVWRNLFSCILKVGELLERAKVVRFVEGSGV